MDQMDIKDLEIRGCRTFICPNMSLIDEKGKELLLKDRTIKRAKELAMKYFKDTYQRPNFSSARHLLPSFVCIASVIEGDKRFQKDIAQVFGTTNVTIHKWNIEIIKTMGLDIEYSDAMKNRKGIVKETIKRNRKKYTRSYVYIHPDLDLIDKGGNILGSDSRVIKKAKEIATKYFDRLLSENGSFPAMETILPSLFYLAHIIENDKRIQMEIGIKFDVPESYISKYYNDIKNMLGMKIICGFDGKTLKVLEEKDDI